MKQYKLLTPGPLTTTESVKKEMMVDHCTWDDDYKNITQKIRRELLEIGHVSEDEYTTVLMQGSGSAGVEAVFTTSIKDKDKILILANGAYGERMAEIARYAGLNYILKQWNYDQVPDAKEVEQILDSDKDITHVSMVHCETTSGILNDIEAVGKVVHNAGKIFILDAMSSFGGVDISLDQLRPDFMISSANKCIQGVPGFSFIICNTETLKSCKGNSRSLSLDLYAQWETMNIDGKWRFTSPTHVVLAFAKAMEELNEEGGVRKREERYRKNNETLIRRMKEMGIKTYIDEEHQSPIITTFFYPESHEFSFEDMYYFIKERGYAIYPGKVTSADTFRIGNIGDIHPQDMEKLCDIFQEFITDMTKEN
ncbi:MAG: 2-aminoethylphosphonate--pyruvate transaminase [Anaerostipes sp.]|jgi:2-aminoethylphosphonate-pyruvate transaminase